MGGRSFDALARLLRTAGVAVIDVDRPNRQVRSAVGRARPIRSTQRPLDQSQDRQPDPSRADLARPGPISFWGREQTRIGTVPSLRATGSPVP